MLHLLPNPIIINNQVTVRQSTQALIKFPILSILLTKVYAITIILIAVEYSNFTVILMGKKFPLLLIRGFK